MVASPVKDLGTRSAGASQPSVLGRASGERLVRGTAPRCWLIQGLTLTISSGDGHCLVHRASGAGGGIWSRGAPGPEASLAALPCPSLPVPGPGWQSCKEQLCSIYLVKLPSHKWIPDLRAAWSFLR